MLLYLTKLCLCCLLPWVLWKPKFLSKTYYVTYIYALFYKKCQISKFQKSQIFDYDPEHWWWMWWMWCHLCGDLDWWEPLYFSLIGDCLVEYLPSFLTCSLEVLWASMNLFNVSHRLEIFLSIICNLFSVILLFSWGLHWVRDTDEVRELCTLLSDALKILVKGA